MIRCVKAGHLPIWVNAVIPISACPVGAALGLGLFYRRWKLTLGVAVAVIALAVWGLPRQRFGRHCVRRRRIACTGWREAGLVLPAGDARFGALLQTAFRLLPAEQIQCCRIARAILALGIVVGHERLARSVGLERDDALVRCSGGAAVGHDLDARGEDSSGITCLSAALAILGIR